MEFEEVPFKSDNTISVWHNFLRSKCKNYARCKICVKVLKCAGGCTTGLQKHLKGIHKTIPSSSSTTSVQNDGTDSSNSTPVAQDNPPKKKAKMTDFFSSTSKPSTEVTVSRMVSLDGLPFRTFSTSEDLRRLFKNDGHQLPKSPNSIREMVLQETTKCKKNLVQEIKTILMDGEKFSLTFDEWTSNSNKRYLNLNLHSERLNEDKFRNLGLLRIHGSMTAEKAIEELSTKLHSYGLDLEKDIVGTCTDGCSLMSKIGRLLKSHHQKCIAHAVQLAVIDVFYKKHQIAVDQNETQAENTEEEDDIPLSVLARRPLSIEVVAETESSDEDEDDGVIFESERAQRQNKQAEFRFHDILAKVRRTVKIFKKSPKKNEEFLQKYVVSEFGKEYQLILDVQTRWSSVANMLSRFLKLRDCVTKALIDLKVDTEFTPEEWALLRELHEVLDTLKTTVEALCRRDATLLTADVAMKFTIKSLDNMKSNLGNEMSMTLRKRYQERRLIEASTLQYLTNAEIYFANRVNEEMSTFQRPNSNEMRDSIVALLRRTSTVNEDNPDQITVSPAEGSPNQQLSKKDELNLEIKKALTEPSPSDASTGDHHDISTVVRVEMALWENGGTRGQYLSLAFKHLSTIPPTSVESERIFSSAGYICNRLRTRLSDRSLDAISFLRTHYQQNK